MARIAKKVVNRIGTKLKTYQEIVLSLRSRDVSEADTVTVIKDIFADVLGYDKYLELTGEQQIRGTFCDLAVKLEGKTHFLVEAKAAAVELNESHLRQAINYGAQHGTEWIILTNSLEWRVYRLRFGQPIEYEEVLRFLLPELSIRNEEDLGKLYMLCRESVATDALRQFHYQAQLLNRYTIAQILRSEPVAKLVRRELRRLFPDVRSDEQAIADIIVNEVLKRDVVQGERVAEAESKIRRAAAKSLRQAKREQRQIVSPELQPDVVTG